MLKKRILASSMASVMALSSVSVVAFAEDKKDYGEAVTKAELQAFVDAEVDFIADELPTYGSKQGERYQAAYDHALKVLDDEKAENADYIAAYQMVKAVKAQLQVYTAKQLQALIDDNKSKYDKNNEFNEELQDNIYTEKTYADFTSAYDDATRYVDSDDSLLITDAYIALEDAVKKLSELKTVTKSDFRTALKNYEELAYKMKDYETWRRGILTVKSTTGTAKASGDIVGKKPAVSFQDLIDIVYNDSSTVKPRYWDKTAWKTLDPTVVSDDDAADHAGQGRWIGGYDIAFDADLSTVITAAYKELDEVKGATITSKPEIVAAYEAAVDAVAVFNGWQVDSYKTGSKGSCANLISKYRPQLVEKYADTDITDLIAEINYTDDGTDSSGWYVDVSDNNTVKEGNTGVVKDAKDSAYTLKHDADAHTLKCNKALYVVKDEATGLIYIDGSDSITDAVFATQTEADAYKSGTGYKTQKISAGTNILGYMSYTNGGTPDPEDAALRDAEDFYATYAGYTFPDDAETALSDIQTLADGKTIAKASGSTTEWTLVWRQLAYALEDRFPVKVVDKYTLADLKKMIDRAYDACEATGDSSLFATAHMDLVTERQNALDWYTEAKATTGYKTDDTVSGRTLATVYTALKKKVEDLEKWLKDFKYSYGEIKADIAKVADAIDKGEVKATDDLKSKLAKAAYDLSVLQPSDVFAVDDAEDVNLAFDSERIFQAPNRLKTAKNKAKAKPNDYEKAMLTSYEALLKAYETALKGEEKPSGVKGDVDGDGVVTFEDVNAVVAAFLASSTDKKFDINGDGSVDFEDVNAAVDLFLKA
ncbi:MAG: hypothetical protein ACI4JS_06440 [Oscillospiraceae bacterium]